MTSDASPWHQRATLRQLLIFDAVMETGSAGGAARRLGLSQPAITHALNKLEELLGLPLLQRGQYGSRGTQAGHILHRRVIRLRALITEGLAAICGDTSQSHGIQARAAALTSTQVSAHVAIANGKSFRAAAERLGISEPAIQRTARELERMMGVPLYRRDGKALDVTGDGFLLASRMQLALAEIAQAHDEIAMAQGRASGRIRLGCLPLMPKRVLAPALGRLLHRFPRVETSLEEGSYDRLSTALRQGRLDMLIGALRSNPYETELEERHLFDDPYVVVCRSGHPLAPRARRPTKQELARYNWVAAPSDTPRRIALDRLFETLPSRPSVVLETNSVVMMIATLAESDCLTLSSREQAAMDFANFELAQLPLEIAPVDRMVGITLRSNWLPTVVQHAFLEALMKERAEQAPAVQG
ncbi:LysR family transcriptional regulator [Nostoc sp. 3335mG]|nr:LysR family transcriptional regulator [Nostoc sp. 3335mG]